MSFFYHPDFSEQNEKMLQNYKEYKQAIENRKAEDSLALQREKLPPQKPTQTKEKPQKELFTFDPNTVSDAGWKKLGLNSGQIKTINKYKLKGGKYLKPEDLSKMYTISDQQYRELLPFIKIKPIEQEKNSWQTNSELKESPEPFKSNQFTEPKKREPIYLNLNTADTTALKMLKGIGPFYAKKIVEERTKLGGFHSISQLLEIWNFTPEMLTNISEEIHLGTQPVKKININNCEIEELANHPYLNWKQANSIVKYRGQHGPYAAISDIQKSHLISESLCQKIQPYLTIE